MKIMVDLFLLRLFHLWVWALGLGALLSALAGTYAFLDAAIYLVTAWSWAWIFAIGFLWGWERVNA